MTREEMIKRVQGCLALTSSTNENEAQAALLMAQKLLAKYHLSMADVVDGVGVAKEEPIVKVRVISISGLRPWVRDLAMVVGKNFRCVVGFAAKDTKYPVFVGYRTDAAVAHDVFVTAFNFCERKGDNLAQTYNDRGLSARGVKVNFCSGFVDGLQKAYEDQIARDNSMALMVVPPEGARKEQESWKTLRGGFAAPIVHRDENYLEGFENGYQFANRKAIEA